MSTRIVTGILLASLAANAAFVAALSHRRNSTSREDSAATVRLGPSPVERVEKGSRPATLVRWSAFAFDNVERLAAQLTAAGFRGYEARALAGAVLEAKLSARRVELVGLPEAVPYWKESIAPDPLAIRPDAQAELRRLAAANAEALERLFGPDNSPEAISAMAETKFTYGDIAPEKIARLRSIESDYDDLTAAVQALSRGTMFPEDGERLRLLKLEKEKDVRALLTAAEYAGFERRSSPVAEGIRNNLRFFEATEEEYSAIHDLTQALESEFGPYDGMTPEQLEKRWAAEERLKDEILRRLGPARAADYTRDTDGFFSGAADFVAQIGLPRDVANGLWDAYQVANSRANSIRADTSLAPEARNDRLRALSAEAEDRVLSLLGTKAKADLYKGKIYGGWMRSIVPRDP